MKLRRTSGSGNRKGIEEEGEDWDDQNAFYICMKDLFFIFMCVCAHTQ